MKRITSIAAYLLLAICLLCSVACADGAEELRASLDAAFAGGGMIRLGPVTLEQINPEGDRLLAISPDGSTVIQGFEIRNRDGKVTPITMNLERGVGDPFEKEKFLLRALTSDMPAQEGVSWSEDGRYIALSDFDRSVSEMQSIDVPVLDVTTGEVYLADSFARKMSEPGMGVVYLNRIERAGKYLYYLVYTRDEEKVSHICFCRCPVEGGEREILFDMADSEDLDFDIVSGSSLYEEADGSWLLAGMDWVSGHNRGWLAMIRFRDTGNGWTAEVNNIRIPSRPWAYSLQGWSPESGWGLFCLKYAARSRKSDSQSDNTELYYGMLSRVNLLRVQAGEEVSGDVWYMIRTGEGKEDVALLPATDYLNAVKMTGSAFAEGEEAELAEWAAANASEHEGYVFPNGYDAGRFIEEYNRLLLVTCAAVSPDGHYAIVNAGGFGQYALYIIRMETMEVRPVDAPEGIGGMMLTDSAIGRGFRPGIVWNADGTLLIQGESGDYSGVHPFVLEVE